MISILIIFCCISSCVKPFKEMCRLHASVETNMLKQMFFTALSVVLIITCVTVITNMRLFDFARLKACWFLPVCFLIVFCWPFSDLSLLKCSELSSLWPFDLVYKLLLVVCSLWDWCRFNNKNASITWCFC